MKHSLKDRGNLSREYFLQRRFKTIRNLTENNYLYSGGGDIINNIIEDPQEVYDTITLVPSGIGIMKGMVTFSFPKDYKEVYRQSLNIEPRQLNNIKPEKVVEHLNTKIASGGSANSILEMIETIAPIFLTRTHLEYMNVLQ